MRAKVTTAFRGVDVVKSDPVEFKEGAVVTGSLAWHAVTAGLAEWIQKPTAAEEDVMRQDFKPEYPPQALDGKPRKPAKGR